MKKCAALQDLKFVCPWRILYKHRRSSESVFLLCLSPSFLMMTAMRTGTQWVTWPVISNTITAQIPRGSICGTLELYKPIKQRRYFQFIKNTRQRLQVGMENRDKIFTLIALFEIFKRMFFWYTHKTSNYWMSCYRTSSYQRSRLPNIPITIRPVTKGLDYQASRLANVQLPNVQLQDVHPSNYFKTSFFYFDQLL